MRCMFGFTYATRWELSSIRWLIGVKLTNQSRISMPVKNSRAARSAGRSSRFEEGFYTTSTHGSRQMNLLFELDKRVCVWDVLAVRCVCFDDVLNWGVFIEWLQWANAHGEYIIDARWRRSSSLLQWERLCGRNVKINIKKGTTLEASLQMQIINQSL